MGFLSPLLLAGAAVLAVPVWLHLRRKRKQAPVEFPSLRYLKMAAARTKRQAKVEDLVLLVLRVLLVALLAAAFARPVLRSRGGWLGAGRAVESVVVIDATASMGWRGETGTRLEAAKRLAREWVNGLERSDSVALWVLTDRLEQPVPVPIADRGHWFRKLDEVKPSEGSSSLAPVFNAAREWVETRGAGRKELVVISDNQSAAWDWPADGFFKRAWHRGDLGLVVLAPDSQTPLNVAVAGVEWSSASVREGGLLNGVVRVVNHGDVKASDLLECRIGGRGVFRKPVELPPAGTIDVALALPVPATDAAVLSGEVALAGDGFSLDDHWYFALPVRRNTNSLVVDRSGTPGGGMRASYFLTRALAAGGMGRATAIDADDWPKQDTADTDSVWFTSGAVAGREDWTKALAFAAAGGTVAITGDCQPDPLPADWPVASGSEVSLPAGRMATKILTPSHPVFDGLWNEQTPFPPLPQRTARRCDAANDTKVLATLAGGFPLVVEMIHGKGRVIWLNASADRSWGDLPLSAAYVPLVQQIARSRDLAMQAATACSVGEAWPDLTRTTAGASWPVGEDGQPSARAIDSGVRDAVSDAGETVWSCAVNVRREESDLRPVDSGRLQAMLPGRIASGEKGLREWREESGREVPLWPWLLGAAALTFVGEGWLSARTAAKRGAGGNLPAVLTRGRAQA